ncbi:MAG TPA: MBL fold metallo-hydrolase [Terriglobia bacterium]|nr:MBL fold metallo-hydrolase [Terriglobia bacterium]
MRQNNAEHLKNGHYHNPQAQVGGFLDLLRWLRTRRPGPWRRWIPSVPGPKPVPRTGPGELRVTFVGHSTVLLQVEGLNVLTDPIWSDRASPVSWAGPRRHRAPGLRLEDLPPIDVLFISHDHYDHLDAPTLRRLCHAHQPAVFCPLGVDPLLETLGSTQPRAMGWWESSALQPGFRVHCTPAQHFSGRSLFNRNRTLWCSWLLEAPHGNVYFGADTGFGPHLEETARRFPPPRLALLPIGAFRPEWFMGPVHMSPDDALRAHRVLGAGTSVAIHHGTFRLADDGETEAADRLRALVKSTPAPTPFLALEEGVAYEVPPHAREWYSAKRLEAVPREAPERRGALKLEPQQEET